MVGNHWLNLLAVLNRFQKVRIYIVPLERHDDDYTRQTECVQLL